jgi:PAS domain S-box-containing protein
MVTFPIERARVAAYFVCSAAFSVALYLLIGRLSPLALSLSLAGCLVILGLFLNLPARWRQARAFARWRDVMPCSLSVQNRDLEIIDANDLFRQDFGDRLGERCYTVYKGTDEPCPDCPVVATFEDGKVHTSNESVVTQDGRRAQMVVTSAPFRDANGQVTSVVEMFTDVTEIYSLRKELEEIRRDHDQLFQVVPCHICVIDRNFEVVESNDLYRRDFDVSRGAHCYEICKQHQMKCPDCLVEQTFSDGQVHSSEETLITSDGRQLNMVVHSMPVHREEGEISLVMEVFTDITQVKQLQRQLTLMGRAVTGMAHRIKNILMGLDGGIFVVNTGMETDDREMVSEGWEMVERNVARVSRLVMDLLYCSKERQPEFKADVCPQDIAQEVADLYEERLRDERIELVLDVGSPPHHGTFDLDALHNMLSNLMANAIDACRFDMDESKASHSIGLRCHTNASGTTVYEVEDNGAGMPEDVAEKVFEDFFSTKGTEGTGVGLLVVQKVAHEHGGDVNFFTTPGQGTVFRVTLPPFEKSQLDSTPGA